ncbi:MAG: TatD family hydrolase [Ottowia sp.]|nr:TatD family hydrolase [Ottowia sp.]
MWIDSHCHLDAWSGDELRVSVLAQARIQGVSGIVLPAVARSNFLTVRDVAHQFSGIAYTLGIHPLYIAQAQKDDLIALREQVALSMTDPRFIGIGEAGLDFFVDGFDASTQMFFLHEQLKLAEAFNLPIILHSRRAHDHLLKALRRVRVRGIVHAFNGSFQQADRLIALGFKLGFGGAMTFTRALQIRRLALELPLESLVLETDAPDMSPAWVASADPLVRNTPGQLPHIAQVLAELRNLSVPELATAIYRNTLAVLPRLAGALDASLDTSITILK